MADSNNQHSSALTGSVFAWIWVSTCLATVIAIFVFAYWVFSILTKPGPLFQKDADYLVERLQGLVAPPADASKSAAGGDKEVDKGSDQRPPGEPPLVTAVNASVALEYANADLRTAGAQIAFALVGGMFFAILGVLLFAAGYVGSMNLEATSAHTTLKLATAAPGVVALVLGGVIVVFGINKNVSRPTKVTVTHGTAIEPQTQEMMPPGTILNPDDPTDETRVKDKTRG
jgi:membrane protein implicated in regulation of membrane protease activity